MKSKQQLLLNFIRGLCIQLLLTGSIFSYAYAQTPQSPAATADKSIIYQAIWEDTDNDDIPDKEVAYWKWLLNIPKGIDSYKEKWYFGTTCQNTRKFYPVIGNEADGTNQVTYFHFFISIYDTLPINPTLFPYMPGSANYTPMDIPNNITLFEPDYGNFRIQYLPPFTVSANFFNEGELVVDFIEEPVPATHNFEHHLGKFYYVPPVNATFMASSQNGCGASQICFTTDYIPYSPYGIPDPTFPIRQSLVTIDYGDGSTIENWVSQNTPWDSFDSTGMPAKCHNYAVGNYTATMTIYTPCDTVVKSIPIQILPIMNLTFEQPLNICGSSEVILIPQNNIANAGYHWSTGANTATITVNNAGTYTVTATQSGNCSATASVTVNQFTAGECCINNSSNLSPMEQTKLTINQTITFAQLKDRINSLFPGNNYFTYAAGEWTVNLPFEVVFNSNLVIDESVKIVLPRMTLLFGKYGRVIVKSGKSLTINGADLTTCSQHQWRGITVEKGATLSIDDRTNILYADTAVSSTAPAKLMVNNSIFSNCYVGIRVAEVFDINKLTITNNHFSSSGLKLPYPTNQKGLKGIDGQLLMAGAVNTNHFEQLNNGIYITASSLNLKDNLFKNIQPYNSPCAVTRLIGTPFKACPDPNYYGVAIVNHGVDLAFVNNTVYRQFTVNIDNSNNVATDYSFDNCQTGVFSLATHLSISNTRLKDGLKGFIVQNSYKKTISIGNNQQENVGYGIALLQNKYGNIKIADNTVTMYANAYSIAPILGRMGGYYGIRANDWPGMPATYDIANNFTYNGRFGIKLENLQGNNHITYNTCNIDLGTIGANYVNNTNLTQYGIYIENCKNQEISYNTIRGGADDMVYDNNRRKTGIFTTASTGNTLGCNTMENLGYSMHVQGDNSPTLLSNDSLIGMRIGVYYNKLGTYAKLGDQGYQWGTGAAVFNNKFIGTVNYAHTYRQTTIADTTKPDKYFFSSTLNSGRPTINLSNVPNAECKPYSVEQYLGITNPNNITLPYCAQQGSGHKTVVTTTDDEAATELSEKEQIAEAMVVYPEFEEVVKWLEERKLYREISEDTTLADESIILDEFYNETTNAVLGKLEALKRGEKEISDAPLIDYDAYKQRLEQLKIANEQLMSQENHELREKQINELFYTTLAKEYTTLSAEQEQLIADLANGCPLIDGEAVYLARAMYAVLEPTAHFDSKTICNNQGYYKTAHANGDEDVVAGEIDNSYCALYPNPAHQQTAINYILQPEDRLTVKVYDVLGREIYKANTNSNMGSLTLPTDKWQNGNYLVKCISLLGKEFGYKLVVSH